MVYEEGHHLGNVQKGIRALPPCVRQVVVGPGFFTHSGVGVTRLPVLEICQSPPSHSSAPSGSANQGHDREHSTFTDAFWGPRRDNCFFQISYFPSGETETQTFA